MFKHKNTHIAVLAQHVTDVQDEDMLDAGNHLKQFKIRQFFSFRYSLLVYTTQVNSTFRAR